MITVGKKWDKGAQYIGRGSPLGNPFVMTSEADRNLVCDQYEAWFQERVKANDPKVVAALSRLQRLAVDGDLVLGCFCAPKRCHGETIKAWLDAHPL